jgi:hypothetical protein
VILEGLASRNQQVPFKSDSMSEMSFDGGIVRIDLELVRTGRESNVMW